jgi:hypothetical protein
MKTFLGLVLLGVLGVPLALAASPPTAPKATPKFPKVTHPYQPPQKPIEIAQQDVHVKFGKTNSKKPLLQWRAPTQTASLYYPLAWAKFDPKMAAGFSFSNAGSYKVISPSAPSGCMVDSRVGGHLYRDNTSWLAFDAKGASCAGFVQALKKTKLVLEFANVPGYINQAAKKNTKVLRLHVDQLPN